MGRIELPSEPWQGPVIAVIRHPHGAEGQCPHCGFPFNSACNLTSEHSRHFVLSHHLSLHQPVLLGKPTPSNCLVCCFRSPIDLHLLRQVLQWRTSSVSSDESSCLLYFNFGYSLKRNKPIYSCVSNIFKMVQFF